MEVVFNEEMYKYGKEQYLKGCHPKVRERLEKILPLLQGAEVEVVIAVSSVLDDLAKLYQASFVTTFDEPK